MLALYIPCATQPTEPLYVGSKWVPVYLPTSTARGRHPNLKLAIYYLAKFLDTYIEVTSLGLAHFYSSTTLPIFHLIQILLGLY